MGINYAKLRSLTAREIVAALKRDGFILRRQSGSHQRYVHSDGRKVTVAPHATGGVFRPKTLRSIIEDQAGWSDDDIERLGLLK